MILALTVTVLVTGGVYLTLQRSMVQTIFGLGLLAHAANFLLLASGVPAWRSEPLANITPAADGADPLPQAFVLTAIVISMAVTILMLAMAVIGHNDDQKRVPATGEEGDA
ncbi:sodium:proton antiporter [Micrococcoides hystricis]|uniref:Sodium:proton antiporter n=1 Tax=Micrococcoides hystricis TaxID=1572761 RepID=A0ABV6PF11_9MICC